MKTKIDVKLFLCVWVIVLALNQIVIFNACFKLYCIVAALPHTFIVSLAVTYIIKKIENEDKKKEDNENIK